MAGKKKIVQKGFLDYKTGMEGEGWQDLSIGPNGWMRKFLVESLKRERNFNTFKISQSLFPVT